MRKFFMTAFVLAATLVLASSGLALEKTAARLVDDSRGDDWNAGTSCSIVYYNYCTGWVWVWSGWSPFDALGVCFDRCCANGILNVSWHLVWTGAPPGYGFTGTIKVTGAITPYCCPDETNVIAAQPYLPASGWNGFGWGVPVPTTFVIEVNSGPGNGSPVTYATDHPAAGPTGPAACGYCYPTTRVNHSFYWGTKQSPLCPGSTFNDGVCDAQLLWDAQMGGCTVAVEEASWGSIKGLYR